MTAPDPWTLVILFALLLWVKAFAEELEGARWSWRRGLKAALAASIIMPINMVITAIVFGTLFGLAWLVTLPWH